MAPGDKRLLTDETLATDPWLAGRRAALLTGLYSFTRTYSATVGDYDRDAVSV